MIMSAIYLSGYYAIWDAKFLPLGVNFTPRGKNLHRGVKFTPPGVNILHQSDKMLEKMRYNHQNG